MLHVRQHMAKKVLQNVTVERAATKLSTIIRVPGQTRCKTIFRRRFLWKG